MVGHDGDNRSASEYVQENKQQLERLIRHSNNDFVRALAIAAFLEFGDDASVESIREDLERMEELEETE